MHKIIKLSPSSLSLFSECPRCFWLDKIKGIKRPATVFPSLPGGMDNLIKKYFDQYRKEGELPPELKDRVPGKLMPDQTLIDSWRNWRKGLEFIDESSGNFALGGALDECLLDGDVYIPADFKTRGYKLKDDSSNYYLDQLSFYSLLLEKNGFKTNTAGYLIWYILEDVGKMGNVKFSVEVTKLTTDTNRAYQIFKNAAEVLKDSLPDSSKECGFCAWEKTLKDGDSPLLPDIFSP